MKRALVLVMIILILLVPGVMAQDFSTYVWQEYQPVDPASIPIELQQRLEYEIDRMIQDRDGNGVYDHLAPYYIANDIISGAVYPFGESTQGRPWSNIGEWHWFNPGELVYTLAYAYPYLSDALQSRVKAYLASEMVAYPPELMGFCQNWPNEVCFRQGVSRQAFALPDEYIYMYPMPRAPLENVYALWLWARALERDGDGSGWDYLAAIWPDVAAIYTYYKGWTEPTYSEIGGLIGFARVARGLGERQGDAAKLTLADEAAALAANWMAQGLDFAAFQVRADAVTENGKFSILVFSYLTPDMGRYMTEQLNGPVGAYVTDMTRAGRAQQWWQSQGYFHGFGSEAGFFSPGVSWSLFLAKAYILGEGRGTLVGYLDMPWCMGDLYYIQKSVTAMEAGL